MFVYVLHFDQPVRGKTHYMGSAADNELDNRLRRHQLGTGANLTRQAHTLGIGFTLGGLYQGSDRSLEKKMKRRRQHSKFCAHCKGPDHVGTLFHDVLYFAPIAPTPEAVVLSFPNASRRRTL